MVVEFYDGISGGDVRALVLPDGTCYHKAAVPRPRWHRTAHLITIGRIPAIFAVPGDSLVHGPAFMALTEDEHRMLTVRPGSVPRSVNDRFERVRAHLEKNGVKNELPPDVIAGWTADPGSVTLHPSGELKPQVQVQPAKPSTSSSTEGLTPMRLDYPPIVSGTVEVEGGRYITRRIGRKSDVSVFREYREAGAHVLTYGQAGTGKTMVTQAAYGTLMMTVLCTEDTVAADFQGEYVNIPGKGWTWVDGPLPICMEQGMLLYVDEIGRARQKQLGVLFSAMDGRREISITAGSGKPRVIRAAPGFAVAASANLSAESPDLDDALKSRFNLAVEVRTDYRMAREQLGIDQALVNAAENLDTRRLNREVGWAPQMRHLCIAQENAERVGMPSALGSLVNSAPLRERDVVADVLSKAIGRKVERLVLA